MDKQMEKAQLLARFKLQVKRTLNESVDLERLTRDLSYAHCRLAEIEDMADDEDLLVLVLRLRDLLLPLELAPVPAPAPQPQASEASPVQETRNYLMGARAW